jgi:hypothetical protein
MSRAKKITIGLLLAIGLLPATLNAQEEASPSPFSVGADFVSSYVWRGTAFGGPALQPSLTYTISGLEIGAWGSYGFSSNDTDGSMFEADLYASYGFDFGLSLGVTDYYYPGSDYFEFGDSISSHAFEANLGYEIKGLSISANYIFNNSINGAASIGGDMYFELGYAFTNFSVFVGAGNGWHTAAGSLLKADDITPEDPWDDDTFGVCNVGISTEKELKISDSFSLPVFGLVSLNPEAKQFNISVGVSF